MRRTKSCRKMYKHIQWTRFIKTNKKRDVTMQVSPCYHCDVTMQVSPCYHCDVTTAGVPMLSLCDVTMQVSPCYHCDVTTAGVPMLSL